MAEAHESGLAGRVDWIAQAALGALIGECVLGMKLGRLALLWGALAGLFPEVDSFVAMFFGQSSQLWIARGIFHSAIILAPLAVILARPLAHHWRQQKIEPARAAVFLLLVWAVHLALDFLGIQAIGLLEPFSHQRFTLGLIPEGNLVIAVPLLIGVIRMSLVTPKLRGLGSKRIALVICLLLPMLFCGFCYLARSIISSDLEKDMQRRGITPKRCLLTPIGHLPVLWRCLVDRGGSFELGYRCIWEHPLDSIQWSSLPQGQAIFKKYAQEQEVLRTAMVTHDWWIARLSGDGLWLADLSQPEWRSQDSRGTALRPKRSWIFSSSARLDRLKQIQLPEQFRQDYSYLARRMWDRDAWGLSGDRLVGNPGAIQEFLPIKVVPRH